jgi:hypothetical protein
VELWVGVTMVRNTNDILRKGTTQNNGEPERLREYGHQLDEDTRSCTTITFGCGKLELPEGLWLNFGCK